MPTQIKIDLTQLFTEERPERFSLVPLVPLFAKQIQKTSTATKTEDLIICPNCKQSHYIKKGKKKNGTQRFKCKECSKDFSLLLKAIDIQLMFKTHYEEQNENNPSMLNTVSRKIHACINDERYRMCFNQLLYEYESKGYSHKECIALAFKESNKMVDRLEWKWLQNQTDNWFFVLNFNDTDLCYFTLDLNQKLVRNYNISLPSQQDLANPLIYCAVCGSSNIVKHGFNHTPRRQIRCLNCHTVSIIRLENIITVDFFTETFKDYLRRSKYDSIMVENIFHTMYQEFYNPTLQTYFQTVVDRTMIITHETKRHILQLFLRIYDERVALQARFSRNFDPYPELKEEKQKLILMLSNPRSYESDYPWLFNWEKNAIDAYNSMIDFYISKS